MIERGRNRMGEKKEESGRGWLEEGREEGREREEGGDRGREMSKGEGRRVRGKRKERYMGDERRKRKGRRKRRYGAEGGRGMREVGYEREEALLQYLPIMRRK